MYQVLILKALCDEPDSIHTAGSVRSSYLRNLRLCAGELLIQLVWWTFLKIPLSFRETELFPDLAAEVNVPEIHEDCTRSAVYYVVYPAFKRTAVEPTLLALDSPSTFTTRAKLNAELYS